MLERIGNLGWIGCLAASGLIAARANAEAPPPAPQPAPFNQTSQIKSEEPVQAPRALKAVPQVKPAASKLVQIGPAPKTSSLGLGLGRIGPATSAAPSGRVAPTSVSATPVATIAHWQEKWSLRVGSTQGDPAALGTLQIAARGPLIAVASRGQPGVSDALDGVHLLDGRSRAPGDTGSREVRILVAPLAAGAADGAADTVGVALDGDFAVFANYGGVVTRMRLDGREAWAQSPMPSGSRPGLPALVDLNGDGILDVIVPVVPTAVCTTGNCAAGWKDLAVALDGYTGNTLWTAEGGVRFRALPSPTEPCLEPLVSSDLGAKRLYLSCVKDVPDSQVQDVLPLSFDGKQANESPCGSVACSALELSERIVTNSLVMADGLGGKPNDSYWLRAEGTQLFALPMPANGGASDSAHFDALFARFAAGAKGADRVEVARFAGVVQSQPTLADIDGDGVWDALLVENGVLHAFSTAATGDAKKPFWRGDVQASGQTPTALDNPAAYASRVDPRDLIRWLPPPRNADDSAFHNLNAATAAALGSQFKAAEPVDLPSGVDPKNPTVGGVVSCGPSYGVNEGSLVLQTAEGWRLVQGAPWPILSIGCSGGRSLELKTADGRFFELPPPPAWQNYAATMSALVLLAAALLAVFLFLRKPPAQAPANPYRRTAREVVVADTPHTARASAHPEQLRLLDGLLNMLDNADTRPPVTLALYGPWGSGKSSVMQMLRSELRDTGRYIDVWFNAWRYHREKDMSAALLQTIVDEVGKKTDWGTRFAMLWNRVRSATLRDVASVLVPVLAVGLLLAVAVRTTQKNLATSLLNGTTLASVVALVATGAHRVLRPLLKVFSLEPAKLLSSGSSAQRIQFVRQFPAEFEKVASKLPRGTRLILFIDDLDRCAPERIVDVLETLSMLADTGRGFFVLALDPTTVRRAIELKYKDVLRLARRDKAPDCANFGLRYLEKMITLGVNVPPIAAIDVKPDERLQTKEPDGKGLRAWWQRVAPQPPLVLASAFVFALALFLWRYPARASGMLDDFSQIAVQLLEPEAPSSASAASPAPAASAAPLVATLNAAKPSETQNGTKAAGTSALPSASGLSGLPIVAPTPASQAAVPRAPLQRAAPPPRLVDQSASPAPSLMIRRGEVLRWVALGVGLACLLGLGGFAWSEWKRRQKIRAARPMVSDSPAFAEALQNCKSHLPANPRSVVRFTNLSRFLYQIVASSAKMPDTGWEPDFFRALCARWLGKADPTGNAVLDAEIERWVPNDGSELDAARLSPPFGPARRRSTGHA